MNTIIFAAGLIYWRDFLAGTSDFRWALLLDSATNNIDCTTEDMADVSAYEPTDGSYSRVAATGETVTPDIADCFLTCTTDDPTWVAFDGGEQVTWLVLYREGASDALRFLIAAYRIDWIADGTDFTPTVNPDGLVQFRQGYCLVT